jgi:hypothetical protein
MDGAMSEIKGVGQQQTLTSAPDAQGLEDHAFFVKATGVAHDALNGPPAAEQISWAKLLAQAKSFSDPYLGGLPPQRTAKSGRKRRSI